MKFSYLVKNMLVVLGLLLVTGCAVNRSIIPVDVSSNIGNPDNGVNVKIVSVEDKRIFEFRPKTPDIPSLSEDEVNNPDIKARAFARKRNGWGKALGDVILPEGQTVAGIFEQSLTNALRKAGYRVLSPKDSDYDEAVPVHINIVQFWSWIEWGFWQLPVHNRSEVILKGDIKPLAGGLSVENEYVKNNTAVFESDWQESAVQGLQGLSDKVVEKLKAGQ